MLERMRAVEDRFEELDRMMADPEVAADYTRVQEMAKEQANLRNVVSLARELRAIDAEVGDVRAMLREESDEEIAQLAREEMAELESRRERTELDLKLALIPKDPNDEKNVIVEIRAGTGGDEAGLFAADLYRMYSRYAQRHAWKTDVIDVNETGIGAVKEIVFEVRGKGAYSRLKHESGVHRVQRVPATESSGRIHTSAATVAVLPEAEEVDVEIGTEDLQIDVFHASGHGGQNVPEGSHRNPYHPQADRPRRHLPGRAQPVQEQGEGYVGAALEALRTEGRTSAARTLGHPEGTGRQRRPLGACQDVQLPSEQDN